MSQDAAGARHPAAARIAEFTETVTELAPDEALHWAKRILLNGLRASLGAAGESLPAGYAESEVGRLGRLGADAAPAGLLWSDLRLPVEEAAAYNEMVWTLLLLDDMELVSGIHPGGPAVAAALPQAVARGDSGRDLLAAIVAGIEVQVAVAQAASPEMLQERGFAPLSVIAPLGAATATLVLQRAGTAVARHAIGIAAMSGIGTWEMGGTSSALLMSAQATRMGVTAVRAASMGIDAPELALDGDFGAYRAFSGKPVTVLDERLRILGVDWQTPRLALQPYSGDTYSQAPLEGVLEIKRKLGAAATSRPVDSITVHVQDRVAVGVERKKARHPRIETPLLLNSDPQSRTAIAWLHDDYSYSAAFTDYVTDPAVIDLRERVTFRADPRMTDMTVARVEIEFGDGSCETAGIEGFRGSPRTPMSDDDLTGLFVETAAPLLAEERLHRIVDLVWHLEDDGAVTALGREVFAAPMHGR